MRLPFELDFLGGAAEHHYRRMRPAVADLPWGTLDASRFVPMAVAFARACWTDAVVNEYRSVAAFTEIARALLDVRAPLDLVAMASDFQADECAHAEMASRLVMELGGAELREVDCEQLAPRPRGTAMQRANEVLLRICCIEESFSVGIVGAALPGTTHPLPRAVNEAILRDEAHHRRLGGLYFEWALGRIDDAERARLAEVLRSTLQSMRFLWNPDARVRAAKLPAEEMNALGWIDPVRYADVARDVVVREVIEPLAVIGIEVSAAERAAILA